MPNNTNKRGFASMDERKRKAIARKGGKASHGPRSRSDMDDEGQESAMESSGASEGSPPEQESGGSARGSRGSQQGRKPNAKKKGGASSRGGSRAQHAKAGRQSRKNR